MRRVVLVLTLTLALLACAMFTGSALSRASEKRQSVPSFVTSNLSNTWNAQPANGHAGNDAIDDASEPTTFQNNSADEGEDPDMPKGKLRGPGSIDEKTFLRLRDEYISRRRGIEPGGPFDPEARGRAVRQMQFQEALQLELAKRLRLNGSGGVNATNAVWTAIGPAPLPNGSGNQAVTGRVTAIVVDPTNSNKVYLATAQGGVWRSLDGGANWTSIFDNALSLAVGSLALAPSNPSILYVGTGESNRSGDSFFGVGVYRIDNADTSATLVGPINPLHTFNTGGGIASTRAFSGRSISQIVVHPTQPGTIFVGTSSGIGGSGANGLSAFVPPLALLGLYRSTNADGPLNSITFQKLAVATAGNSLDSPATGNRRVTDVIMEPGNPDTLIVGVFGTAAPNDGGIYRTTNALSANPTFTHVKQISIDRIQFAINKDFNTGVVKVLAATGETPSPLCSSSTQLGVLRQSVDGGVSWPDTSATATTSGILTDAGGFCGGQCFYNVTVAIDPQNANNIYLGGNVPSACSGLMQRSTNGVTFSNDSSGLHADSHALFFDPLTSPSTIFTGNDGGVWKRSAGAPVGTAWTNLNSAPLNTMQFESVAVHPLDQFMTIGGTQDNGTEAQLFATGNWTNAEGGDGGYALIDQSATDTTSVTMYHTFFNRTGTQIGFDRIVNVPNCLPIKDSWPTRGDFGIADIPSLGCDGTPNLINNGISRTDNVLFYAPMALGPGTPNTVYFGTDRLYRSSDRGDHMVVVSQAPLSAGGPPISTIAISPQDDNYRLLGLQSGQLFATSSGSSSLVNITGSVFPSNPGSPSNAFIGRAVFDPHNKDIAYVALSYFAPGGQGIWKITNFSAATSATPATPNWTNAANGIPSVPINALVIDPIDSNTLYAGTDIGVFNSTDSGANWAPYGTGLPRSAVFDMAIQSPSRILRVATHGRGIWEVSIPNPAVSHPNVVQFSTSTLSATETLDATTKVDITVNRAGDTAGAASIDYATADGTASERSDYLSARGTLHFDPGQTTKTVSVFIVDDRFGETDETFTVTLSNPVDCTLGSPSSLTVTISSNESVNGTNPVKNASFNNDFFVRQHYLDFFNREPDAGGLAFWKNQLNECENFPLPGGFTDAQQCREIRRINVSAAFFLSIEFQQTGYLVERLYKVAYGEGMGISTRGIVHQIQVPIIRLNEFLPDTQAMGRGVIIGQPGAEQILENNKQAVIADFVSRPRFIAEHPLFMTPAQFVDSLHWLLPQAERDQLVNDLTTGAKTRAQVVRAVAENPNLFAFERNSAFVLVQYFGYLRRNPNDAPEVGLDYTGYDFWLNKLQDFGGNFVNAEMVKAFITSGEYQQRFGP
jgi:hypothetical protein